jgi:hypothetical protein
MAANVNVDVWDNKVNSKKIQTGLYEYKVGGNTYHAVNQYIHQMLLKEGWALETVNDGHYKSGTHIFETREELEEYLMQL